MGMSMGMGMAWGKSEIDGGDSMDTERRGGSTLTTLLTLLILLTHTQTGKDASIHPITVLIRACTCDFYSLTSDQRNVTEYGGAEIHGVHDLNQS